jgi:hypothetical protein
MRWDDAEVAPIDGHRVVRLLIAALVCLNVVVFSAKEMLGWLR